VIVTEAVIVATVLCTSASCGKRAGRKVHYYISGPLRTGFQISTDSSLQTKLTMELKNIPGVRSVAIDRKGNQFDVSVVLETLDFAIFDQVVQREVYLFDEFPEFKFRFSILPADAIDDTLSLHAA
jgi:hypothetical protein